VAPGGPASDLALGGPGGSLLTPGQDRRGRLLPAQKQAARGRKIEVEGSELVWLQKSEPKRTTIRYSFIGVVRGCTRTRRVC